MSELVDKAIIAIESDGYCKLPSVFSSDLVDHALEEVKKLHAKYSQDNIKNIPRLDQGQETIYNLQNKSLPLLKLLLESEVVEKILMHFLNDQWHKAIDLSDPNYILRSFSARNNQVAAPMHIDSFIPYTGRHSISIQTAVILENQTIENGCTIVVPGTHQSGEYVRPEDRGRAIAIEASAGDVVIWDSRIWHGTHENKSGYSRWSLIATFVRWWVKQGYQITESLPHEIYLKLSNKQKAVLGYCSEPFKDETEGIDFKRSYESLP